MSLAPSENRLTVPESLQKQLGQFRQKVWSTKMTEVIAMALSGILIAFCTVFAMDRWIDTPTQVRFAIFFAIIGVWAMVPWAWHRWVWSHRHLHQLAKLLRKREPSIGDQLLGVIELAESDSEQTRSRSLCAAAMEQVAEAASRRDLTSASPLSHHRGWLAVAGVVLLLVATSFVVVPSAAMNALARMMSPWSDTPRYTFAMIQPLPDHIVVAHGEPYDLHVGMKDDSRWRPAKAQATIPHHPKLEAELQSGSYSIPVPPLTEAAPMNLRVGDYLQNVTVEPKLRPELTSVQAKVRLPEYLQLPDSQVRDARSGTLSVVAGSTAILTAKASRPLAKAMLNESDTPVRGDVIELPEMEVPLDGKSISLSWSDADQLAGREPFQVVLQGRLDEAPSVTVEGLPRQAVILDSEQINFQLFLGDDFGIKRAGIQWKGMDERLVTKVAEGEAILSSGAPDRSAMQLQATFCPKDQSIEPQPIEVRVWVEDYLPNRERMLSPPHLLYVLSPDQHAIWMTEQLSKWHRQSLDVRDRELQLHETNKQLRDLAEAELQDPETQRRLETQAAAEGMNGRRLAQLTKNGEELIRQASRNPEIGVGHLERWAEMLQVLKDISGNRMPEVEDLLKKAAQLAQKSNPNATGPSAGKVRDGSAAPGEQAPEDFKAKSAKPPVPSIADRESSQQPLDNKPSDNTAKTPKKPKEGRLTLPTTTVAGPAKASDKPASEEEPVAEEIEEAVKEQADLLAEFDKITDELNSVLANLEGSTLVKRLKAASREQLQVANKLSDRIDETFSRATQLNEANRKILSDLSQVESKTVQTVSFIMDDLQAYFERRRMNQFKLVLDEMRELDILSSLRVLGDEIPKEQGMSLAQCEFWSDTLDRWADDLVDPACKGNCPGGKSPDSLPPSIILEVLQILEGEVNLREETRVAEQARSATSIEDHGKTGSKLAAKQDQLQDRILKVVERILELPDPQTHFGKELALMNAVEEVMGEAGHLLGLPETGPSTVAAETEAIELLLKSKRINPKGGGGGGSAPGGGGKGTTNDSALALVGSGINAKENRERREIQQATGELGQQLPEEFRAGLDEYFNRLEIQ